MMFLNQLYLSLSNEFLDSKFDILKGIEKDGQR